MRDPFSLRLSVPLAVSDQSSRCWSAGWLAKATDIAVTRAKYFPFLHITIARAVSTPIVVENATSRNFYWLLPVLLATIIDRGYVATCASVR